jgi:hypothetical protein
MTTAFLDSQEMLGINAKAKDRVTVQISVTCSPVGLARNTVQEVEIANATFLEFFLGPTLNDEYNFTYLYKEDTERSGVGYLLE